MNNIAVGDRIRVLRKSVEMNQKEFALLLGVSQNMISRYEGGEVTPGLDKLNRIIEITCEKSGRDINWLVSGRVVGSNNSVDSSNTVAGPAIPLKVSSDDSALREDFFLLPLYDVFASSGAGSFVDRESVVGHLAFSREWIESESLNPASLKLIRTQGDSMSPTISNGDTLLVDHGVNAVEDDAIYVIRIDDTLMVKRLQKLLNGGVCIKSDNPNYSDHISPPSEATELLRVVGRVVWIGRRV